MARTSLAHLPVADSLQAGLLLVEVRHGQAQHEPAPRVGLVRVARGQADVEVVHLVLVVPQAAQPVREQPAPGGVLALGGRPVAVVALVRDDPAGPRHDVRDDRHRDRGDEGGDQVAAQHRPVRVHGPCRAARADVPQDRHQAERGQDVEAVPLRGEGQAQHHARRQPPWPPSQAQGLRDPGVRAQHPLLVHRQRVGQSAAGMVPVGHQAAERGQHEEHDDQVEQRGPAHHEMQPVHREQQPRQTAQERGAEQPPADPAQQEHGDRAQHRHHEAPAERREAEHLLAEPDDPLADRRMHHIARVGRDRDGGGVLQDQLVDVLGPGPLVPLVDQRPRVLRVVRLVEYHRVRLVQLPEAQQPGDQGHQQRAAPAGPPDQPVGDVRRDREHRPHLPSGPRVRRVQPVAERDLRAGNMAEAAQPPLPGGRLFAERVPGVLAPLGLGCGTRHRAIVGNASVRRALPVLRGWLM